MMRFTPGAFIGFTLCVWGQTPDGGALFKSRCATCHTGETESRAPAPEALRQRTAESIVVALENGSMRAQGKNLSGPERRAIVEFLVGKKVDSDVTGAQVGRCTVRPRFPNPATLPEWNGWGPDVTNTRFQTAARAGLTAEQVPHLTLKWALGFPDAASAWAQPTVAGGRVFVGSQNGTVYSVDAKSGCIYWTFSAHGGVRTAVAIGPKSGSSGFEAVFADTNANLYAVDVVTGEQLWMRQIDDHPLARITGSPTVYQGRVYVGVSSYEESQGTDPQYGCCSFRGSVSSVDAKTGKVVWKTYTVADEPKPRGESSAGVTLMGPSGAPIWSAPTIDAKRKAVYFGTGNTYSGDAQPMSDSVVALDLATGKIRWFKQATPQDVFLSGCRPGSKNPSCPDKNGPDFDFGNSPILTKLPNGRDAIVIGQKSGVGFALDPDKEGEIVWQYRAGRGGALGGIEWGAAVDANNAYFPVSDIFTAQQGGLHAVNLATGERVWYTPPAPLKCKGGRGCSAAQPAAISVIPGVVFSGSNDGGLRAYSTKDGSIIWEFDTNREFETVNGIKANGASMQGPGPTIAGGMLFVNSGYGAFGGRPGNVLLAFGVE